MPPSHMDFIRARIVTSLNAYPGATDAPSALDHGTHIAYMVKGRTYEITVKEVSN